MVVTNVIRDLVLPIVSNPQALMVKELESLDPKEVICVIYAPSDDIGRLIGKKGQSATALRQVCQIASRLIDKRISIKFETLD